MLNLFKATHPLQAMMRQLTWPVLLIWGVAVGIVFEAITLFMRFGLKLESTRDTASTVGVLTFGLRVHHGYIGLLMMLLAWSLLRNRSWAKLVFVFGVGLFLSDMVHHFLVLWPITGHHEFYLVYPD